MKKNTMMRIASVLLVAVLLSTCTISGTFAKYVTEGSGSDTARVAKWGVTIAANGEAFGQQYKASDGTIDATYTAATDSVHSSNTDDVIAPGTNSEVAAVVLTGTPEVDCHVEYASTITVTGGFETYCPIIFTVGSATYGMKNTGAANSTYETVAELLAAVEAAIEASSADYECGTNLGTDVTVPSVSWEWPFVGASGNTYQTDAQDTTLGNTAATGTAATITIAISIAVTQLD